MYMYIPNISPDEAVIRNRSHPSHPLSFARASPIAPRKLLPALACRSIDHFPYILTLLFPFPPSRVAFSSDPRIYITTAMEAMAVLHPQALKNRSAQPSSARSLPVTFRFEMSLPGWGRGGGGAHVVAETVGRVRREQSWWMWGGEVWLQR